MGGLSEGLVYVDEHLLVLDKPAGLLAVPGRGSDKQDCLAARAQALWGDARVVHRLDMATSGLFLMARSLHVQRVLGRAFEERRVDKRYEAVVAGTPSVHDAAAWQRIELPLAPDWPQRPRQKVDTVAGRPSTTLWLVLDRAPAGTRLELMPLTGRSHQLRVHLLAIGHPILGDTLYAPTEVAQAASRLLLHACALAFEHPATGERVTFSSPPPF